MVISAPYCGAEIILELRWRQKVRSFVVFLLLEFPRQQLVIPRKRKLLGHVFIEPCEIHVSFDWLDVHCLPCNQRRRLPNTEGGHGRLSEMALCKSALVCFEATGGQEWRLWATLDAAGIATRQLPPAQIKAFLASQCRHAKPARIDAELIARFMVFRHDAGRRLPHKTIRLLRALVSKCGQIVVT
ncbi:transposase [Shimia sp. R11_0]|nr:transposase [Shimia sp. R11_0]